MWNILTLMIVNFQILQLYITNNYKTIIKKRLLRSVLTQTYELAKNLAESFN